MSETKQNYKNHARYDPAFHFFVIPLLLLNLVIAIRHAAWQSDGHTGHNVWRIVMSVVFLVAAFLIRIYALRVQDRVIRLEEQMRLMWLLPETQHGWIGELSMKQLVALRFASNAELPALAERALREKLTPVQIKQAIVTWRADTFRV